MNYSEKLKDPRWQKMRLEILQRDKFECIACHDSESELHVHHLYYLKDKEPWEYDSESIVTLCNNCHSIVHSDSYIKTLAMFSREIIASNFDFLENYRKIFLKF